MRLGLGLGIDKNRLLGGGFAPDYQAVLDKGTLDGDTLPSSGNQTAQNAIAVSLSDIIAKADLFYVMIGDGDSGFSSINWANPSAYKLTLYNSPVYTPNYGFNSDGTSYLGTNLNMDDSTHYTQDDACYFGYFRTMPSTSASNSRYCGDSGLGNYSGQRIDGNGADAGNRTWMNSSANSVESIYKVDNSIVFANRTGATATNNRSTDLDNSLTYSSTDTTNSSSLSADERTILVDRGSNFLENGAIIGVFYHGESLSVAEMELVESTLKTYELTL